MKRGEMKKKLFLVLSIVLVLSLIMVVPVAAKKPLKGHQELIFNMGFFTGEGPCPTVTWAGNLELGGAEYGIAFFPTAPLIETGQTVHFVENWKIYAAPFEFAGGVFDECEAPVAMYGTDAGIGNNVTGVAQANGKIIWIDPEGPLGFVEGKTVHWKGTYGATPFEFGGPYRIN